MDNTTRNTEATDKADTQRQQGEDKTRVPEINNNDEGVNDNGGEKLDSELIRADEKISQGKNVDSTQKRITGDEDQRNVV